MKLRLQYKHIKLLCFILLIFQEGFIMGKVYQSITELIGGTPLLRANNFIRERSLAADLLVKLEYFNPAGSVKDRIAKAMRKSAAC